jgi:OOP family OmpA-OmpF porin
MSWKMIWVSVVACCCILAWATGSGAESHKRRVDLTGRQDLKTEEIIAGLTPVRTRGIKTRGLQPGLATIALTVNFAFDSAEIQPQAIPNLQSLGQALQSPQLAPYQIRIEGHTDSVGTAAYNRDLSQRRAESVKQYLTQHFDITPDHLITAGKGEEEPISDNDTDAGRYKNRRAEFVNLGRR